MIQSKNEYKAGGSHIISNSIQCTAPNNHGKSMYIDTYRVVSTKVLAHSSVCCDVELIC